MFEALAEFILPYFFIHQVIGESSETEKNPAQNMCNGCLNMSIPTPVPIIPRAIVWSKNCGLEFASS